MQVTNILKRKMKENEAFYYEYENQIKECEKQQKELEHSKRVYEKKMQLITYENNRIAQAIQKLEANNENN